MMENIKRFQIDVETSFDGKPYKEVYPLEITDLESDYQDALEGVYIAEIEINGDDEAASFLLSLDHIQALFDVLTHIRNKVLEKKPQPKDKTEKEKN